MMGQPQESIESKLVQRAWIIDDEDYVCQYMSLMMRNWGVHVTTATTIQAVDFSQMRPSDVIFVDMMMPGTDGIQVLETLSRHGIRSRVVLMSGTHIEVLGTAERIARQQGLRVAGILGKPFRSHELRRILEEDAHASQGDARWPKPSQINIEDVLKGLERHEFDTHFQPIVDLTTHEPRCYEALARWRSEKFSLVMPDRFIAVAARHGILPRLTQQVANKALSYSAILRDRGLGHKVSVNIGAEDFVDHALPEKLANLMVRHDLPPHSLTIELTESSATTNETKMLEVLARMHLKGIDLAIDDFGRSYSGLERLSIIPFAWLKIDMRFISDMMTHANARTIVESSIALAKRLKMTAVAEGIETEEQLTVLKALGCDCGQGYLFAQPMEFEKLLAWIPNHLAST